MRLNAWVLVWLAAVVLLSLAAGGGFQPPLPQRDDRLGHEAYVWQRQWTPAVVDAVRSQAGQFERLVVLAAQIDFVDRQPRLVRVALPWDVLADAGVPIGLALRIGPFSGPFDGDDDVSRFIRATVRQMLSDAAAAGLAVSELQIDFDAATSKLDGYRIWLDAIRAVAADVPVVFTALPTWLDAAAFADLATAADSYVLQVHSVYQPSSDPRRMTLCDPAMARQWVEQAARLGHPFRVALPTYSYLVAFSPQGKLLGIAAEQGPVNLPDDARVHQLDADAAAMADLVRQWQRRRPAALGGVIWYRLPTRDDTLNWPAATLASVMAGRRPEANVVARLVRRDTGVLDVLLANHGSASAPLPTVTLRLPAAPLSADALAGYTLQQSDATTLRFTPGKESGRMAGNPHLFPGVQRVIGWCILAPDASDMEVDDDALQLSTDPVAD